MPTNNFVESSFWNFDALFQPQQHPARWAAVACSLSCMSMSNLKLRIHITGTPMTHFSFPNQLKPHCLRRITWKRFGRYFCIICNGYSLKVRKIHSDGGWGSQGYGYNWKREEAAKNLLRTHTTAVSARMLYRWTTTCDFVQFLPQACSTEGIPASKILFNRPGVQKWNPGRNPPCRVPPNWGEFLPSSGIVIFHGSGGDCWQRPDVRRLDRSTLPVLQKAWHWEAAFQASLQSLHWAKVYTLCVT